MRVIEPFSQTLKRYAMIGLGVFFLLTVLGLFKQEVGRFDMRIDNGQMYIMDTKTSAIESCDLTDTSLGSDAVICTPLKKQRVR